MVSKYIIMCGGNYKHWNNPRQLSVIKGEILIERTIRLLRENGIEDISISSDNPIFEKFGVPVLKHDNLYNCMWHEIEEGYWFNCFYPTKEPVCYIFGDVYFSDEAIKTIVETDTDDIEFFASSKPFAKNYIKEHEEPFALKVFNIKHLKQAIKKTKELDKKGAFKRKPIMWELWSVIKNIPLEKGVISDSYISINDCTCDIDWEEDIKKLNISLSDKEKDLSIILPYYKTYDLTAKILDVLIPQLNDRVELIVIDDGCQEERLDKYSNKNTSIIHLKENVGGASASNVGINMAIGQYIGFIDSDDMIAEDYIKTLLETLENHNEEMIFFDWQDMGTGIIVHHPSNYAPWKAIYKNDIVPKFPDGRVYSYDVPFYDEINSKPHTKYYIDKVLYYYNSTREDNLTHLKAKAIKEGTI